ncbi:MAG: hypothetical protein GX421_04155 [Caldisericales bacterium]|nr:hypothetical protein [Caldisericales bacterium]
MSELKDLLRVHKVPGLFTQNVIDAWRERRNRQKVVKTTAIASYFLFAAFLASLLLMLADRRQSGA